MTISKMTLEKRTLFYDSLLDGILDCGASMLFWGIYDRNVAKTKLMGGGSIAFLCTFRLF